MFALGLLSGLALAVTAYVSLIPTRASAPRRDQDATNNQPK